MIFREPMFFVYLIPVILVSLSFHELSHGLASYRLGDPTARDAGRLTLNPLKHLDPLGTIMIIASSISGFGLGWAKPVPFNPLYYKNRKAGTVLVSIAGPLSNILLAFLFYFPLYYFGIKYGYLNYIYDSSIYSDLSIPAVIFNLSKLFFAINVSLAVFNIIPVPPLDGSKILTAILPSNYYFRLMQYERYVGMVFIAVILVWPKALNIIIDPLFTVVADAIDFIVKGIFSVLL